MPNSSRDQLTAGLRLGGFLLALVVVFAAALGLGRVTGAQVSAADNADPGSHGTTGDTPHAAATTAPPGPTTSVGPPGGLLVAEDGYRLDVTGRAVTGRPGELSFRIIGPDGHPVTRYHTTHERDLHLIIVGRDLAGYEHLHPRLGPDGVWSTPLQVNRPGPYRVIADFHPAGHERALTLGADLSVPGDYRPVPLPPSSGTAAVDGYAVTLDGRLEPGTASRLTLRITHDGTPVTDLQPYLGAAGHLVALRADDVAYLHTHPDHDSATGTGPEIVFSVDVPSTGTYRLYLEFQHRGQVHTVGFTAPVTDRTTNPAPPGGPASATPAAPTPHSSASHSHGE